MLSLEVSALHLAAASGDFETFAELVNAKAAQGTSGDHSFFHPRSDQEINPHTHTHVGLEFGGGPVDKV